MLNFKFGRVVDYAYRHREWVEAAAKEFFQGQEARKEYMSLFNEWLIFDFKPAGQTTIANRYFLENPDNLPADLMSELEQILKSQVFDLLEIEEIKRGSWLKVYSFVKKKRLQIWDKTASADAVAKGTLMARVGQAGNRWYFVGSDPWRWPFSSTERYKTILAKDNHFKITVKDAYELMKQDESKQSVPTRKTYTKKELKNIRKKLEKKYQHLAGKYSLKVGFDRVIEFIYQENYTTNFSDAFVELFKLTGVPETALTEAMNLFQELWNFFPHKILHGQCPAEKFGKQQG